MAINGHQSLSLITIVSRHKLHTIQKQPILGRTRISVIQTLQKRHKRLTVCPDISPTLLQVFSRYSPISSRLSVPYSLGCSLPYNSPYNSLCLSLFNTLLKFALKFAPLGHSTPHLTLTSCSLSLICRVRFVILVFHLFP